MQPVGGVKQIVNENIFNDNLMGTTLFRSVLKYLKDLFEKFNWELICTFEFIFFYFHHEYFFYFKWIFSYKHSCKKLKILPLLARG